MKILQKSCELDKNNNSTTNNQSPHFQDRNSMKNSETSDSPTAENPVTSESHVIQPSDSSFINRWLTEPASLGGVDSSDVSTSTEDYYVINDACFKVLVILWALVGILLIIQDYF